MGRKRVAKKSQKQQSKKAQKKGPVDNSTPQERVASITKNLLTKLEPGLYFDVTPVREAVEEVLKHNPLVARYSQRLVENLSKGQVTDGDPDFDKIRGALCELEALFTLASHAIQEIDKKVYGISIMTLGHQ